jgi:hypothetical protein
MMCWIHCYPFHLHRYVSAKVRDVMYPLCIRAHTTPPVVMFATVSLDSSH